MHILLRVAVNNAALFVYNACMAVFVFLANLLRPTPIFINTVVYLIVQLATSPMDLPA